MPVIWRLVLTVYNILLLVIAAAAVAISVGVTEPLQYINMIAASPNNLIITGTVGIVLVILALILLYMGWQIKPGQDNVLVEKGLMGEVSMSIDAIKLIIMKAVRQVNGVKETRSMVKKAPHGLIITLHMMINPELNVPELTSATQQKVKEYLENIGGLQIAEIKVLVDDFNAGK